MEEDRKKRLAKLKVKPPRLVIKKAKPKLRLTIARISNTMASQFFRMFRVKTGLMGCSIFSIAFASYAVVNGP